MTVTVPLAKYVIANKQIKKLDEYVTEEDGEWVLELLDEEECPEQCISVYYRVDTEKKTIKERLYMASYHKKYEPDFKEISIAWLEDHFVVEKSDLTQLDNQYERIVKPGGQIFTLLNKNGEAVGVTAIINMGDHAELGKMGVKRAYHGNGYANPLMFEAIQWAKKMNFTHVDIHTAAKLTPAITLYKKFGFYVVPLDETLAYERVDLQMKLDL